jgi:hypothetical protein
MRQISLKPVILITWLRTKATNDRRKNDPKMIPSMIVQLLLTRDVSAFKEMLPGGA